MKIVADENIPFARECFSTLGEVELKHGRHLTKESVQDADILFVRSITKINENLLKGTKVKFVGSATAGIDHVDTEYLKSEGIGFSSAPGSNANSVAEYVITALLIMAEKKKFSLEGLKIGIIGVGNVGTRVLKKIEALGMIPILNDPPLAEKTGDSIYKPLEELLNCDIITCHTPLTKDGDHPTYHLLDKSFLDKMKKDSILFNTARGGVVDEKPLKNLIQSGKFKGILLDVWENEPEIDLELLNIVDFGSPHIAGYSYDGKVLGTQMIYEGACGFFKIKPTWNPLDFMAKPENPLVEINPSEKIQTLLCEATSSVCKVERDNFDLRKSFEVTEEEKGPFFDKLRKEYPRRWEFPNYTVNFPEAKKLGFKS